MALRGGQPSPPDRNVRSGLPLSTLFYGGLWSLHSPTIALFFHQEGVSLLPADVPGKKEAGDCGWTSHHPRGPGERHGSVQSSPDTKACLIIHHVFRVKAIPFIQGESIKHLP